MVGQALWCCLAEITCRCKNSKFFGATRNPKLHSTSSFASSNPLAYQDEHSFACQRATAHGNVPLSVEVAFQRRQMIATRQSCNLSRILTRETPKLGVHSCLPPSETDPTEGSHRTSRTAPEATHRRRTFHCTQSALAFPSATTSPCAPTMFSLDRMHDCRFAAMRFVCLRFFYGGFPDTSSRRCRVRYPGKCP